MTQADAYAAIIVILSISTLIKALEMVALGQALNPGGALAWRVVGSDWLRFSRVAPIAERLFGLSGMAGLAALSAIGAVGAAAAAASGYEPGLTVAAVLVASVTLVLYYRQDFGTDGADQMSFMISVTVLVAFVAPLGAALREVGLWFLCAQLMLAYIASGASKLASPIWRSGEAVQGVLTSHTYGNAITRATLPTARWAAFAGAWIIMVGECALPLALLLDPPWLYLALAAGFSFHIGVAVIMGLNAFIWSFGAAYPAAIYIGLSLNAAPA